MNPRTQLNVKILKTQMLLQNVVTYLDISGLTTARNDLTSSMKVNMEPNNYDLT